MEREHSRVELDWDLPLDYGKDLGLTPADILAGAIKEPPPAQKKAPPSPQGMDDELEGRISEEITKAASVGDLEQIWKIHKVSILVWKKTEKHRYDRIVERFAKCKSVINECSSKHLRN